MTECRGGGGVKRKNQKLQRKRNGLKEEGKKKGIIDEEKV